MEIGDVFAVNKADLPGADDAAGMIERALAVAYMGEPGVNQRHATTTATPRRAGERSERPARPLYECARRTLA
jgi:putative protein kinase ArgK-like GTPase of G3E family